MINSINIYDENWVYDFEKRLYITRGFLNKERAEPAAERTGLILQYSDLDVVVCRFITFVTLP